MLGPLLGGELLAIGSWRLIFLINIPFVIACATLIMVVIPRAEPRAPGARRVDVPGALLCSSGLGAFVFALIEQPRLGWSGVIVPLIAGIVLLGAFLAYESRAADPMLPLDLFRHRNFAAGNIETFSMYAGLSILFFFLVLFLQQVAGYSPLESGLTLLPITVVMFLPPSASERSPTAMGRACSWASARSLGRPGCCCSSASARTWNSCQTCCRRCSSSRSACR